MAGNLHSSSCQRPWWRWKRVVEEVQGGPVSLGCPSAASPAVLEGHEPLSHRCPCKQAARSAQCQGCRNKGGRGAGSAREVPTGTRDLGCQQPLEVSEAATGARHGAGLGFAAGQKGWGTTERRERVFPSPSFCSRQPLSCERCPGLWFGLAASPGSPWMWLGW